MSCTVMLLCCFMPSSFLELPSATIHQSVHPPIYPSTCSSVHPSLPIWRALIWWVLWVQARLSHLLSLSPYSLLLVPWVVTVAAEVAAFLPLLSHKTCYIWDVIARKWGKCVGIIRYRLRGRKKKYPLSSLSLSGTHMNTFKHTEFGEPSHLLSPWLGH